MYFFEIEDGFDRQSLRAKKRNSFNQAASSFGNKCLKQVICFYMHLKSLDLFPAWRGKRNVFRISILGYSILVCMVYSIFSYYEFIYFKIFKIFLVVNHSTSVSISIFYLYCKGLSQTIRL